MSFNEEWKKVKLGDIADFKYGKYIPKKDFLKKGYPVHNGYGIKGYLSEYKYEKKQLIIVARGVGGTGDVKMSPPKCTIANLSIVINPDENKIKKEFLYWLLKYSNTYSLRTGSAQPQIIIKDLKSFIIKYPESKNEQKEITKILSSLDKKIENNNKMNKTLEKMAQAIYKSWFVDFEPFQDEEFNKGKIKEIIEINLGNSPKSDTYNEEGIGLPLLNGASDFDNGRPTSGRYSSKPKRIATKGEILLCTRGTIGHVSFADRDYCIGRGVSAMKLEDEVYNEYVYFTVKYYLEKLKREAAGSVIRGLTKSDMLNIPIVNYDKKIFEDFHKLTKPIINKQLKIIEENKTLSELRDSLLPKLMSGKIRVPLKEDAKDVN